MSTLPPHDVPAIFWIDGAGQQQGPEPLATVIERIAHDQIPSSTPVWWQGAVNWLPFNTNAELSAALEARLAPAPVSVPAPQPEAQQMTSPFAAEPSSAFSAPAPSESASPFASPNAFDTPAPAPAADAPTVFETPAVFAPAPAPAPAAAPFETPVVQEAPAVYDAPATFETPAVYDAPATFETPAVFAAPAAEVPAPVSPFEPAAPFGTAPAETYQPAPTAYDVGGITPAEATAPYEAPASVETPYVNEVPAVIVPDPPAATPTLSLGDPSDLRATFASLTERSAAFDAEVARAASLDQTLLSTVRQGLTDLGFTIEDTQTSDDYHSFRLSEPDGSSASLAIQRIPAAIDVASSVERPIALFVDRTDRASVGLFFGDYLSADGSTDQSLFDRHLASVVQQAGPTV